jgi:hypothetical protein
MALPNLNISRSGVTTAALPELPVLPVGAPDATAGESRARGARVPNPRVATVARTWSRLERRGIGPDVVMGLCSSLV